MEYFLNIVKKHRFAYIVIISAVATVLVINNAMEFAERIINNRFLLLFSLVAFYCLVWIAIRKEVKRR